MLPSLLKINMQLAKLGHWYQMRLKKVGDGLCFVSQCMEGGSHRQVWEVCVLEQDGPRFTLLCSHVLVDCSSSLIFLICKVAIMPVSKGHCKDSFF